jgi:hypothetical protein
MAGNNCAGVSYRKMMLGTADFHAGWSIIAPEYRC